MKIKFEKIEERDVDLLVMNNIANGCLIDLFLEKVNKVGYVVKSIEHSYADLNGENDITVIVSNGKENFGILIEDKINAPAMEQQAKRYDDRGKSLVESGVIDSFEVFIIAPQKYLDRNNEAQKYRKSISYEDLLANVRDDYSKAVLTKALNKSKPGYCVNPHEAVSKFWQDLYSSQTITHNPLHSPKTD